MNEPIILMCTPLSFYTEEDEDFLFAWLKKIKSIKKIKGVGLELHLQLDSKNISDHDLLNLMAIFDRYNFDSNQLRIFMNEGNKEWFLD